ncbi:MAG: hypothetical protein QOI61_2233 [Actinomycetota bacterium]|jgi:AcrR family transcriptional regulator
MSDAGVTPTDDGVADPLREQLLAAAARVFASKGYAGTKIMDIVREAGLSSGAVYGRFNSKNELLTEAVVRSTRRGSAAPVDERVADLLVRGMSQRRGPLSEAEALQVEAFVAARRDEEVAEAIVESQRRLRAAIEPLVQKALHDGTAAPGIDVDSVLYFIRAVNLGLLLQRGAGMEPPPPEVWEEFVARIVGSLAGEAESSS